LYVSGALEGFPLDINRRNDVTGDKQLVLENPTSTALLWSVRHKLGNGLSALGNHDGLPRAFDLIQ
jgi:hypothetical protein